MKLPQNKCEVRQTEHRFCTEIVNDIASRNSRHVTGQNNTNPIKNWSGLVCNGRVNISCSVSGTCRATLVINPVISHDRGMYVNVVTITDETYP